MKIIRIAQNMNILTNPEGTKNAFKTLEYKDMDKSYGWSEWEYFLSIKDDLLPDLREETINGIVASIYGQGGGHRYHIMGNGDVAFSEMHADPIDVRKAEQMGFSIS